MIKGMTGFGHTELSIGKLKGIIEIKSVNHRYLDIGYYLPTGFGFIENKVRQLITKRVGRGRITVSFKIVSKPDIDVSYNKKVAKEYLSYSKALKKELGLKGDLTLPELIQLPGVIDTREIKTTGEKIWPSIEKFFSVAIKSVVVMRQREGQSLARDIRDKLKRMLLQIKTIQSREKGIISAQKKRLSKEEFVSYLKGSDVNEEISRLAHHISEIKKLLHSKVAAGKKIDFIAQEMQRETNTIGAKVQDRSITNAVIALKSKIEKIREQAQNIE